MSPDAPLMQVSFDSHPEAFRDCWTAVVNGHKYELSADQTEVLQKAIDSGSRGMIRFREFVINIPFIEEFYFRRRELRPEFRPPLIETPEPEPLPVPIEPPKPLTEEQKKKLEEERKTIIERSKMVARGVLGWKEKPKVPQKSPEEFERLRKIALQQAERILSNGKG